MRKLTKAMKSTLSDILQDKSAGYSKATIQALIDRGLVDEDSNITREGRNLAISFMPLKEQAEMLNLRVLEAFGPYDSNPEYFLWDHFKNQGFDASYCEGGAFLTILKSAALPILAKINTFNSHDDACTRFLEAQFTIHKEKSEKILDAILKVKLKDIEANFEEIYKKNSIVRESYPGLSKNLMSSLFKALYPEILCDVAKLLFEYPYTYRNGWPDLTLVKNGRIWLVEVKTTDRFHLSQIRTIPRLQKIIPAEYSVVHLKEGAVYNIPDILG